MIHLLPEPLGIFNYSPNQSDCIRLSIAKKSLISRSLLNLYIPVEVFVPLQTYNTFEDDDQSELHSIIHNV